MEQKDAEIDIEEPEAERPWQLCCSRSSPQAIKFVSQMTAASVILIFSLFQLATKEEDREIYISMCSMVIGILFPSPHLGEPDKKK